MEDTQSHDHAQIPPELRELIDSRAILQCLQRIARGMDRFDREHFLSAFHDDAVFEAGVFVNTPEACYEAGVAMHSEAQKSTQHYLVNHTSEIEGDTAHAETYVIFVAHNRDDTIWCTGGRYIDRLERRDGEWKVAFRHTTQEWAGMLPPAAMPLFAANADTLLNGTPSRDRNDPSYRRPLTNRRKLLSMEDIAAMTMPPE